MKKTLFTISLFIFFSITIFAQSTHWQRYYSRDQDEEGYDICTASDGNIYTGGLTSDPPCGWLLKLNTSGDTIWTKRYSQFDCIYVIEPTSDGGCMIAGNTNKIVKVTSSGDSVWTREIQGVEINEILKTNDGNYLASGNYYSSSNVSSGLIKFSDDGNIIWQKEHSLYVTFYNKSITKAVDNGYIIIGWTYYPSYNAVIVKADDDGNFVWQKQFKINNSNSVLSSIAYSNNRYIITGTFGNYNSEKIFLLKTNILGDTIYSKVLQSDSVESLPYIIRANSNRFFLSNIYKSFGSEAKIKIRNIDTNFSVIKKLNIEPSENYVYVNKIQFYTGDNSGDILLAGITDHIGPSNEELYAARIDSALKPPPGIGIKQISSGIQKSFSLSQNYPNPFNPVTKIKFALPPSPKGEGLGVRVIVYDILGREVSTLVNEQLKPGTYEVTWNALNYPSGVYFYSLYTDEYSISKKMILIK